MQDFLDKFIAPGLFHDINHLLLTLCPDVALEAYENRPVIYGNGTPYRFAHVKEWDALAEGVSVSDNQTFDGRPHIDLYASCAMG